MYVHEQTNDDYISDINVSIIIFIRRFLQCIAPTIYTVKPLYSEQSRDPNFFSLYGGVHPRGVRYVHAHMCQKYNVHIQYIKTD